MKIEKIEKSKHKRERVLVFFEEGDLLKITDAELLRFGLFAGMDVPDELVAQIRQAAGHSETQIRAAHMASSRMLSKKELCRRLEKKGATPDDAAEAAERMEELGAVNDEAYAGVIVRHYGGMGYGEMRVRQELQRRGVPKELWDAALLQMPDPHNAIAQFIQSKCKGAAPDRAQLKKLSDALLRRGFSWRDIRPVLNQMGENIEE
ncbi:MAG: RecX family transcriptional regulator [Eubacteriales bacterium]|nr:RecX family transcriptional regulator [Eubacteriales bacterium]